MNVRPQNFSDFYRPVFLGRPTAAFWAIARPKSIGLPKAEDELLGHRAPKRNTKNAGCACLPWGKIALPCPSLWVMASAKGRFGPCCHTGRTEALWVGPTQTGWPPLRWIDPVTADGSIIVRHDRSKPLAINGKKIYRNITEWSLIQYKILKVSQDFHAQAMSANPASNVVLGVLGVVGVFGVLGVLGVFGLSGCHAKMRRCI